MQPAKSVSVLVVADDLQSRWPRLRESLASQSSGDFQIILVDNASSGPAVEVDPFVDNLEVVVLRNIRRQPKHVCLNRGLSLIMNRWEGNPLADRFVLFLSVDAACAPQTVEMMLQAMRQDPTLIMAGADIYPSRFEEGSGEIPNLELGETHLSSGWVLKPVRGPVSAPADPANYFAPAPVAAMVRASAISQLGADVFADLDPSLLWLDFAWRIRAMGGRALPADRAVVWMQPGATLAKPGILGYLGWVWGRRMRLPVRVTPSERRSWFV